MTSAMRDPVALVTPRLSPVRRGRDRSACQSSWRDVCNIQTQRNLRQLIHNLVALSPPIVRGLAGALFYAASGLCPASASMVVVPDQQTTVQSAIDSGADTVLIREGTYAERPVVNRAVVLLGAGAGRRPQLGGLTIDNSNFWAIPPLLSVGGVDFCGPVTHSTTAVHPRNLQFTFTECGLDSGFVQLLSLDPNDVASLTLLKCSMGSSHARAFTVVMDSDTVNGGVAWRSTYVWIQNSWFRGANGVAVQLRDQVYGYTDDKGCRWMGGFAN